MREVIMGYQGEMSLKGLNRNQFESTMMKILRYRLKTVGKFRVYCTQSTFYMEPEEDDMRKIPSGVLLKMIGELPEGYRTIFNLSVFENMSHKEIAAALGISESTSASQFHRARKLLARKIKEYGKGLDR